MDSGIFVQIVIGILTVIATIWAANYTVKKAFELQRVSAEEQRKLQQQAFDKQREEMENQRKLDQEMQQKAFSKQHEELETQRKLNDEREFRLRKEHKKRLVLGMLTEMWDIYSILNKNQTNPVYSADVINASTLFDTVLDQNRLLDNLNLIGVLFDVRSGVGGVISIKKMVFQANAGKGMTGIHVDSWGDFRKKAIEALEKARPLLIEEYPGLAEDIPVNCNKSWY